MTMKKELCIHIKKILIKQYKLTSFTISNLFIPEI